MKRLTISFLALFFCSFLFANPFNSNLTSEELTHLESGEVLIKNIKFKNKMCLAEGQSEQADQLISQIKNLNPKYLAEVIQIRPIEGNEDLPEKLNTLLNSVSDYAGIPYWSEQAQEYFDLYSKAEIVKQEQTDNKNIIYADLLMQPFGTVNEYMELYYTDDCVLYLSKNLNKLSYYDSFDCVGKEKMNLCIYLFKDGDNWILYGIGGVNAPRIPFFTERIETSFINRIKTFCNFIFTKI